MSEKEKEQELEEILEDLEKTSGKAPEQEDPVEDTAQNDQKEAEASEETEEAVTDAVAGEAEEADQKAETEDSGKAKKESRFGKKKVDKKEEAYKEKIAELEDKVKRQMAEFDNFRKRTEKEKSQMFEAGAKSVIEKILPTIDNFERGLVNSPEDEKGKAFADGMSMVYKQLLTELDGIGVKPIEAVGTEFNPEFHNAVMQDADGEGESGTVTKELQKGYMYRDSVIRHSMVAVKN
ncbi:MAG: nucleotide exchange factor GrpE [Lachnospiraceae bacterium]|nr:nucleotide exchange factor GrpE [Lachnospiraceae bacterium]